MTNPSPLSLRKTAIAFAEAVKNLAFSMPSPNAYTPQFVQMAQAMQAAALSQEADSTAPASEHEAFEARSAALATNQKLLSDYIDDYELDDGEHCPYVPNENEKALITDAIQGLLADQEFIDTFNAWQDLARPVRATLSSTAPVASEPRMDKYSELAEALGCDCMDSHEGRLKRARRLAAKDRS